MKQNFIFLISEFNTKKSSPCNVPGQHHDIERTTGGWGSTVCQDQAVLWTDLCIHRGKFGMNQLLHVLIAEWFNMKGGPCSIKAQKKVKTVHTAYIEIHVFFPNLYQFWLVVLASFREPKSWLPVAHVHLHVCWQLFSNWVFKLYSTPLRWYFHSFTLFGIVIKTLIKKRKQYH